MNLETVSINHIDLSGRQAIELSHALNFTELNIVAILEFMTLVFMNCDNARVSLSCIHNDERFSFLAIGVVDIEVNTVVQEGETLGSIGLGEDKADFVFTTEIVSLNHIIKVSQDFGIGNNVEILEVFE